MFDGLMQALYSAALGIGIAAFCYAAYNYLVHRVNLIVLDMERASREAVRLATGERRDQRRGIEGAMKFPRTTRLFRGQFDLGPFLCVLFPLAFVGLFQGFLVLPRGSRLALPAVGHPGGPRERGKPPSSWRWTTRTGCTLRTN